jgi:hypothetical protein
MRALIIEIREPIIEMRALITEIRVPIIESCKGTENRNKRDC